MSGTRGTARQGKSSHHSLAVCQTYAHCQKQTLQQLQSKILTKLPHSSKSYPFCWSLSSSPASPNLDACIVWQAAGIWIREPLYRKPPILIIRSDYWFNLLKSIHTLYLPHKKPCFISAREQRTSGGRSKSNNSPDPNSPSSPLNCLLLKWQRSLLGARSFFLSNRYIFDLWVTVVFCNCKYWA